MMAAAKGLIFNKYVAVFLIVMAAIGWNKYQNGQIKSAKAELAQAVDAKGKIIAKLDDAARYNNTLKLSLEMQAEDAEVQARAADQARAKERLAWQRLNKLKTEIQSATDNPPIPDALESVLDAYRVRSAVPGDERPDSDNVSGDADEGGPLGPVLSDPAAPTS